MHPRKSSTIAFLLSVVDLKFNRFLFFFSVESHTNFFKEAANIKTQIYILVQLKAPESRLITYVYTKTVFTMCKVKRKMKG